MTRAKTLSVAEQYLDNGQFIRDLTARVAIRSESARPDAEKDLRAYLELLVEVFHDRLGFQTEIFDNPRGDAGPILIAERHERSDLPTVFCYGHGDVVAGMEGLWANDADPWTLREEGDKIFGRGVADNKGQHTTLMLALEALLATNDDLGFNCKFMIDTVEETGSPGVREFCRRNRDRLQADLFIASDGPNLSIDTPTIFCGARGSVNFDLTCDLRAGGHHSGNWGGVIANPGVIIANAIAACVSATGKILLRDLVPSKIPASIRRELKHITIDPGEDGPALDKSWWGEEGLSPAETVYAWTAFEVLAFITGNPDHPVNAVPPKAWARCQVRHTPDVPLEIIIPAVKKRLEDQGIQHVTVHEVRGREGVHVDIVPTRLEADHPAVKFVMRSIEETLSVRPAYLPNAGGTICNDAFAHILGIPTVWIPVSYPNCSQHAPDEHLLKPLVRRGLMSLAGVFWDCGHSKLRAVVGDVVSEKERFFE